MKTRTLGFIGGGRITKVFLQAFKNKNVPLENVKVFDTNSDTVAELKNLFPEIVPVESAQDAASQELLILAVHPPVMLETLQAVKPVVNEETVVISLAPKITNDKMASVLSTKKLVRMIPNATSFINAGYNPVAFYENFDETEKKQVKKLLKKLGRLIETEENKLESYAMASAMLPTYFWFQWKELEKISEEIGLTPKEAQKAVSSTLKKAWKLYYKSGLKPEEVMDLIPVKPIAENEAEIREILNTKLVGLFNKIKP